MRGREEARQARVLREREDLPVGQERDSVVEGPQLPVGGESAVVETPGTQLR
jgi:hypothetical protein